jgi:hypothetical protein
MAGFGYKTAWLAIQALDPIAELRRLGANQLEPIDWRHGIHRAYRERDIVVATPPLPGADGRLWVLATGWWLAIRLDNIDVVELSATTGSEVQLFATHRVVETHKWERAISGTVVRSFEYRGDTGTVTRWYGDPDAVELGLGLPATPDPSAAPTIRVNEAVAVSPGHRSELSIAIAARTTSADARDRPSIRGHEDPLPS